MRRPTIRESILLIAACAIQESTSDFHSHNVLYCLLSDHDTGEIGSDVDLEHRDDVRVETSRFHASSIPSIFRGSFLERLYSRSESVVP